MYKGETQTSSTDLCVLVRQPGCVLKSSSLMRRTVCATGEDDSKRLIIRTLNDSVECSVCEWEACVSWGPKPDLNVFWVPTLWGSQTGAVHRSPHNGLESRLTSLTGRQRMLLAQPAAHDNGERDSPLSVTKRLGMVLARIFSFGCRAPGSRHTAFWPSSMTPNGM